MHRFEGSPYHYFPSEGVAIAFITIYAVSTLLHVIQTVHYRMWWLFPTVCLAGVLEIIGWSGRLWSSLNPPLVGAFQMQITATILGPTPLLAANFVILSHIIHRLGTQFSRLSPKWYTIIFCTCDVVSLVVQGVGGGMASQESSAGKSARLGGNIMLGGIAFQLATITIFFFCAVEFIVRYLTNRPVRSISPRTSDEEITGEKRGVLDGRIKAMIGAMAFNTLCLFIRAVYRTIELSNGWDGRIISTQIYFIVLDGVMITLAIYTINIAHPGFLLGRF